MTPLARRLPPVLLALLCAACALRPPAPTTPVLICPGSDAVLLSIDLPDDAVRQRWQRYQACDGYRLLKLLRAAGRDPLRLQAELERLQADDAAAPANAALARLLLRQIQTQNRLQEQNDRLQQQGREQQKRADELAAKLEALRRLELDLQRPAGPTEGNRK
ncbi:hypothetical protein ACPRNU_07490 [Chromobacterium vaccinii]|uniref:hypothetical protein n=1 Tax=Chromobacterium vaccinii TaxID=1108595 RepID=UPI003C75838E